MTIIKCKPVSTERHAANSQALVANLGAFGKLVCEAMICSTLNLLRFISVRLLAPDSTKKR